MNVSAGANGTDICPSHQKVVRFAGGISVENQNLVLTFLAPLVILFGL